MARKQSAIVTCDCPGCKNFGEVEDLKYSPPEWYKIFIIKQDGLTGGSYNSFDICSLPCMAVWAGEREMALNGTVISPLPVTVGENGRKKSHQAGAKNKSMILKAIEESDHPLTTRELVEIIEIKQSSIDRHVRVLADEGKIVITEGVGQREGRTYTVPTGVVVDEKIEG